MAVNLHFTRIDPSDATDRPPLLLAHGLLGQGRNFGTLARGFGEKRSVISVDMRNHGVSPWDDRMDYDAMADDLATLIARETDGTASVLGHSMGGKAAMVLALKRPELLESLVVADIAPVAYDHDYYREFDAMQTLGLAAITRRAQADEILAARIPQAPMRAFLLQNLNVSAEGAEWKPNLAVLRENMPALTGWEETESLSYFGPTQFVTGGDSPYVAAAAHDKIKSLFPKAEFASITGAGHWLHAERPKPFFEKVDDFLSRNTV